MRGSRLKVLGLLLLCLACPVLGARLLLHNTLEDPGERNFTNVLVNKPYNVCLNKDIEFEWYCQNTEFPTINPLADVNSNIISENLQCLKNTEITFLHIMPRNTITSQQINENQHGRTRQNAEKKMKLQYATFSHSKSSIKSFSQALSRSDRTVAFRQIKNKQTRIVYDRKAHIRAIQVLKTNSHHMPQQIRKPYVGNHNRVFQPVFEIKSRNTAYRTPLSSINQINRSNFEKRLTRQFYFKERSNEMESINSQNNDIQRKIFKTRNFINNKHSLIVAASKHHVKLGNNVHSGSASRVYSNMASGIQRHSYIENGVSRGSTPHLQMSYNHFRRVPIFNSRKLSKDLVHKDSLRYLKTKSSDGVLKARYNVKPYFIFNKINKQERQRDRIFRLQYVKYNMPIDNSLKLIRNGYSLQSSVRMQTAQSRENLIETISSRKHKTSALSQESYSTQSDRHRNSRITTRFHHQVDKVSQRTPNQIYKHNEKLNKQMKFENFIDLATKLVDNALGKYKIYLENIIDKRKINKNYLSTENQRNLIFLSSVISENKYGLTQTYEQTESNLHHTNHRMRNEHFIYNRLHSSRDQNRTFRKVSVQINSDQHNNRDRSIVDKSVQFSRQSQSTFEKKSLERNIHQYRYLTGHIAQKVREHRLSFTTANRLEQSILFSRKPHTRRISTKSVFHVIKPKVKNLKSILPPVAVSKQPLGVNVKEGTFKAIPNSFSLQTLNIEHTISNHNSQKNVDTKVIMKLNPEIIKDEKNEKQYQTNIVQTINLFGVYYQNSLPHIKLSKIKYIFGNIDLILFVGILSVLFLETPNKKPFWVEDLKKEKQRNQTLSNRLKDVISKIVPELPDIETDSALKNKFKRNTWMTRTGNATSFIQTINL